MKIAVLMYGQPRFLEKGYSYFSEFFKGIDVDYFFHLWGNEQVLNQTKQLYKPKDILVEKQIENLELNFSSKFDMSYTTRDVQTTLSPLYSIMKVGELLEKSAEDYDFVALTRTDVAVFGTNFKKLIKVYNKNNSVYVNYMDGDFWKITRFKMFNKNRRGVDLKFLYSRKDVIIQLTKIYNELDDIVTNKRVHFCHHRIFYYQLSKCVKKFKLIKLHNNDKWHGWHYIRKNEDGYFLSK